MKAEVSAQTRANRVSGARKAAATRKRQSELRAFLATGAPMAAPARGSGPRDEGAELGFRPGEIIDRIRKGPSTGSGRGGG